MVKIRQVIVNGNLHPAHRPEVDFMVLALTATVLVLLPCAGAQDKYAIHFTTSSLVPEGATISLTRAGSPAPGAKGHEPLLRGLAPDGQADLPGPGPFDLYLVPKTGRPVRFLEKWSPTDRQTTLKLAEKIGAVHVRGDDLPRASKVILTAERDPGPGERGHVAVQEADGYRVNLLAPPGFYAVWITPANGARPQRIADRVRVHAGKVTVVE
jgi:hypothetical protein